MRRTGDYLIGPKLGVSPVKSIHHCLGRRDGTDRYYLLKILHLGIGTKETQVRDCAEEEIKYRGKGRPRRGRGGVYILLDLYG